MLLVNEMLYCKENIYVIRSFIKVINIECNKNDME